ncbi:MAG: phosphate ABC transporter substrate-binding protein [Bacillota bacterium]|nr:phosphate ABC transporter substrate-binding protein [Bacillota bacterium]
MKSKKLKVVVSALLVTLVAGAFVGCGSSNNNTASNDTKKAETTAVSGSITVAGSTALQPLAEQAVEGFKKKNPDASVTVQGGGSGTGLTQVSQGAIDIGNSDVTAESKLKDQAKQLQDHKVCVIGFAMVTSKDVTVKSLTKEQIQKIFTGEVTNWKDVGGNDLPINVINRPASSGTRATFISTVMGSKTEKEGLGTTQDSSGAVKTAMMNTKGAISYLAMSYLTSDVVKDINVLQLDSVEANKANITSGKYGFCSYEHMYTKGEAKDVSKAFIDYIMSADNKALVEKLGYIPMADMKVELK